MDPIGAIAAVLQISKNAYSLGSYIHKVYEGAKRIDESIVNLANEVDYLANSCGLVHNELRIVLDKSHPGALESRYDKDGRLGRCVDQQVAQCDVTLKELGKIVDTLWPRKATFIERASKQIDLQHSRDKIDGIRKQIRSHTDALHTILLVVNIRVAHIAPNHTATQELPTKLDELQRSLTNIESKLGGSQRRRGSVGDGDTTLVSFARETLRSGKTLYEASLAGSVRGADSVMGGELAAKQAVTVAEWVSTVNNLRRESCEALLSDFEPSPPSVFSDEGRDTIATRSTSGGGLRAADLDDGADYDSDDEQVELARAAFHKGNQAFDAENWTSAAKFLHTSLRLLHKLPQKHKRQQDIFGLQYRLAVCSYHTGDVDHAEVGLETLLQHGTASDKEGIQLCDARHLLSRIYVERNKLELARAACESTLKARSRLLGKKHQARFESMALMSRIWQLLQDEVLSELYATMIPDDRRDDLLKAVATMQPLASSPVLDAVLTSPTTSGPRTPAEEDSRRGEVPPQVSSSQYLPHSYGSLPSSSPHLSPSGVSPKTLEEDVSSIALAKETTSTSRTTPSSDVIEESSRWLSTDSRASHHSGRLPARSDTLGVDTASFGELPQRPGRIYSEPVITFAPQYDARRSTLRAASATSDNDVPGERCPPLRSPMVAGDLRPSLGPISRSERHVIVKHYKIEPACMHNLDQSIIDNRLEKSQTLISALHTGSIQSDNPATSVVFNQWTSGLRMANKSPALHLAVLFGDHALVKPLVNNGFSPNFEYQVSKEPGMRDYLTPLDLAIASRDDSIIRELLANGAILDPSKGESPCRQLLAPASLQLWPPSVVSDILSTLTLLLSSGWPVSKSFARHHTTSPTPTLLHQACSLSASLHDYRLPLVKFLLEQPDNATLSAFASETPLHHAIRCDDLEVVDALLQAQSGFRLQGLLEKRGSDGYQPLYLAVQRVIADRDLSLDIIRHLLDHRASLDHEHTQIESRRLRTSKKTHSTARSTAMESGRQDLIDLVRSVENKQLAKPLMRSRTVSDDVSMRRSTLPRIGVLR
jgi:ankyrin repeat protein